ncbi:alpha/beta-hydrolase [Clathrospora elynae]|uniref:Alpha/beta-hydrolase n=1 Tax=Clathrospora elynae TaxID=706981 RepID=A0A6A5SEF1_9PLEO|nr:alpha/beta-hydrolase [Clathrospora elynae]
MALDSEPHIAGLTVLHTHTVVFVYGRRSDSKTFCEEIFESQDTSGRSFTDIFPSIKWVFPCAKKSFSEKDEEEMYQWFDMSSVQHSQEEVEIQKPGIQESARQLLYHLKKETLEVPLERIIVAGISQGCATAIYALLTSGIRVEGFFGLYGWLPLAEDLQKAMIQPGRVKDVLNTPLLLQHSKDDGVIPVENGEDLAARLKEMGMHVRWECFNDGGH